MYLQSTGTPTVRIRDQMYRWRTPNQLQCITQIPEIGRKYPSSLQNIQIKKHPQHQNHIGIGETLDQFRCITLIQKLGGKHRIHLRIDNNQWQRRGLVRHQADKGSQLVCIIVILGCGSLLRSSFNLVYRLSRRWIQVVNNLPDCNNKHDCMWTIFNSTNWLIPCDFHSRNNNQNHPTISQHNPPQTLHVFSVSRQCIGGSNGSALVERRKIRPIFHPILTDFRSVPANGHQYMRTANCCQDLIWHLQDSLQVAHFFTSTSG